MARTRKLVSAAMLLALATAGPSLAGNDVSDSQAEALEQFVRHECGSCHGLTLKGGLGPDLRPARLANASKDAITSIILNGIPDTAMPPWKTLLKREEAEWIADYLLKGDRQ